MNIHLWAQARTEENCVIFHQDELRTTKKTGKRPDVLNSVYQNLKKWGLISVDRKGHTYTHVLSSRCIRILEDLEGQKMTKTTKTPYEWASEHTVGEIKNA